MSTIFGLGVPADTDLDPVAEARRAEDLGFDFVSCADHPCGTSPTHEVWTMLTWIAASTSKIKVMPKVLGIPYRPPAMVAKMAATLDRLSNGRLILGLGGGYSDEEFRAFGLPVPSARDKVDGMAEAIQIIRGLWTEPEFTFTGRIFHTDRADLEPKPERHIPIWLGTYGPRALTATGRLADGWIPSDGFAPPDQIPAMRQRILDAADHPIDCVYNLNVRVDDGLADRLRSYLDLGFTGFNFQFPGPDRAEQIELLAPILATIKEERADEHRSHRRVLP